MLNESDLREEFAKNPWWPWPNPWDDSVEDILVLLNRRAISANKYPIHSQSKHSAISHCSVDSSLTNNHLKYYWNEAHFAFGEISKFIKGLPRGDYMVTTELSYLPLTCHRSDIGVFAHNENTSHIILGVEIGTTTWSKIKDCLLTLPNLKEIWHILDGQCFVWRRGINFELLVEDERKWKQLACENIRNVQRKVGTC